MRVALTSNASAWQLLSGGWRLPRSESRASALGSASVIQPIWTNGIDVMHTGSGYVFCTGPEANLCENAMNGTTLQPSQELLPTSLAREAVSCEISKLVGSS